MALFKQKTSKNWWISIYRKGQSRKYIPTGTPDREKAEVMERLIQSALKGNVPRERLFAAVDSLMGWDVADGLPIAELWPTYEKTRPAAGDHTVKQRRGICKLFVEWLGESHPSTRLLNEVTPQQAQDFSDWVLETKGGRGKTHNNRMGHIKTVFKAIVVRANLQND